MTALPNHLAGEVRWWVEYHEARGRDPTQVTWHDAECWVFDVLSSKSHSSRCSAINAVNQWLREYHGRASPWVTPHPYALLARYLPMSFEEAWAWVLQQPPREAAWTTLVLLCRATTADCMTWQPETGLKNNRVYVGDRVVPVTDTVVGLLTNWEPPRHVRTVAASLPEGVKVTDLHAALQHALHEAGVPETTRASVYGRWSAMSFRVARGRVSWFRVPAQVAK